MSLHIIDEVTTASFDSSKIYGFPNKILNTAKSVSAFIKYDEDITLP